MADIEEKKIVEPDIRQKPPPSYDDPGPQIVTTDTARQAPLGAPVLMVLIAGLAGAVVLLGVYYLFWAASIQ
jgi:hypothetical protein